METLLYLFAKQLIAPLSSLRACLEWFLTSLVKDADQVKSEHTIIKKQSLFSGLNSPYIVNQRLFTVAVLGKKQTVFNVMNNK